MYLKYLDVQGFKSFPDKTRVAFGRGLTCVVGPNGSGKSNISDAVRWVLGEQSTKTLRGDKMEDVIFSGTATRKAQSFAEVSLTLDNTERDMEVDSDEVIITRRYDRSGESEYLINRSPVRLKDVTELLMDTGLGRDGYSLIGQGKIDEIINCKSTDRREIFEEAAGIAKYRYRKNESERSLVRAEENLIRLRDILSELEDRIEPLRIQSQKARQYLDLTARKKTLEVSLWVNTIEESNQALKNQSDRLLISQEKHSTKEREIEQAEEKIQAVFEKMQECLIKNENLRRQKSETEAKIAGFSSQIAVYENDILHQKQNIERISGEIAGQNENADSINLEIKQKREQIKKLLQRVSELETNIGQAQQELLFHMGEDEKFSQRERELTGKVNALILEQSQAEMAALSADQGAAELEGALAGDEERRRDKKAEAASYMQEKEEADRFYGELCERAETLENAFQGHKIKFENRRQKLTQYKQELDKIDLSIKEKSQRIHLLEEMEQSMEGFVHSVREVVRRGRNGVLPGILGTVSQIIRVKEEYSTAIETAVGGALQNIVVESEASAKAAIRLLKEENLGRATFLPLTSVSGQVLRADGIERYAGFIDLAVNLIEFEERYRPVMNSILGRVAVVDDIDTAVLVAQKYGYKFKIVTLDGQVVNAGGSLTGGSRNKTQGLLNRKNEVASLRDAVQALKERHTRGQASVAELQAEVGKIEAEYTAILSEITTVNEDKIRVEGEQKRLAQLLAQAEETLSGMERELENRRKRLTHLRQTAEEKRRERTEISNTLLEFSNELTRLQASNQEIADKRSTITEKLAGWKLEQIAAQKDREAEEQAIAALESRSQSAGNLRKKLEEEQASCRLEIESITNRIEECHASIETARIQAETLDVQARQALEERQRLEGETTELRRGVNTLQDEKEQLASELVRMDEKKLQIQAEFDGLILKLWEEYELTRSEAQQIAQPLEDAQKAKTELGAIRNKIRSLGSVNVDAIEEYRQVSERYRFLNAQIADAEHSKAELLNLIGELTEKMVAIFADNFEKINRNFQTIFTELFGGGKAELRLSEPANILESGVEISAEPPGKVIHSLSALSGGEKALIAISIYFAILKVHPSPFCILDEIEAALDDVNVDKYAVYLHRMCTGTQCIAITHRRGTMESADVLYGVTMQDDGVSKLLELKVSEIEEKLHMKTGQT